MPTMPITEPTLGEQLRQIELLSLYPAMDSVADVIALAESRLPICSKNEVITLLRTYHNTLLTQISKYR